VVARGEALHVPLGRIHIIKIGEKDSKVCSVLVLEKGKPLVIPVQEATRAHVVLVKGFGCRPRVRDAGRQRP
jgi:hypothetical protein